MKKIALLTFSCLLIINFTHAQNSGHKHAANNEERVEERATLMMKKYGFPQSIWTKLVAIKLQRLNAADMAKATKPMNREEFINANKIYKAELKNLLTPQQFIMVQRDWNSKMDKHEKGRDRDDFFDVYEDD